MSGSRCGVCGAAPGSAARYCEQCGAALDATVLLLGGEGQETSSTPAPDAAPTSGWSQRLFVPLAIVAAVLVLGWLVFSGGDPGQEAAEERDALSEPVVEPEIPAEPSPTSTATASPTPLADPMPFEEPVGATVTERPDAEEGEPFLEFDASLLPTTAATHLVVAGGREVYFIDLENGEVTEVGITSRIGPWTRLDPFGDGVLVESQFGNSAVLVSLDGVESFGRAFDGGEGQLVGTGGGLAFLVSGDFTRFAAIDATGSVVREGPAGGSFRLEITDGGLALMQAGSTVYAIGAEEVELGQGLLQGVLGDWALVQSCDSPARCQIDMINAETRERKQTPIPGDARLIGGPAGFTPDGLVSLGASGGPLVGWRLVGDEVVEFDVPSFFDLSTVVARDESGVEAIVDIRDRQIAFVGTDGSRVVLDFDVLRLSSEFAATFVTVDS